MNHAWKKLENEAGYPVYVNDTTGKQQPDHPQFLAIMDHIKEIDNLKYTAYRTSFKLFELQKQLCVPALRISSGVFARHQLSLSESSLSLDATELEAVLADVYFASEKEGLFNGEVDFTVDLVINLILNIYDGERKQPIRVLAAKTLLIVLSEDSLNDKWQALANCASDHNGCVSARRMMTLLSYLLAISSYLGDNDSDWIQKDVDDCFSENAGMLGVSACLAAEWATNNCNTAKWMALLARIQESRNNTHFGGNCAACCKAIIQMLRFKCSKCNEIYFCEKCYLYDNDLSSVSGHKRSHLVQEIVSAEAKPGSMSFIKGMRRFLFCRNKKKKNIKKGAKKTQNVEQLASKNEARPAIFTSTVGKASGNKETSPTSVLQDIIAQLESQNKALKDLSEQLKSMGKDPEDELRVKVDSHWNQISTQISRLKLLKENISLSTHNLQANLPLKDKKDRMQAFGLFSPIPVITDEKQSKVTESMKNQPRVLSLDSGNFSVVSKQTVNNLMTMSGDALKPVFNATSDSISMVSMNDISTWYNETEQNQTERSKQPIRGGQPADDFTSLCASDVKFDADLRSVASSNHKMKELNADLDTVLDRLQQILTNNFAMDDSCFDNTQLRETANEMEGLLGTLIRGVEQRATLNASKGMV